MPIKLDEIVEEYMHDIYLRHDRPIQKCTYEHAYMECPSDDIIKKMNDAFGGAIVMSKRMTECVGTHNVYGAMLLFLQNFDLRDIKFCRHNHTSYEIWVMQYFCKMSLCDAEYINYLVEDTVISFSRDGVGKLLEAISKNKWCNVPKVMMSIGHSSNGSIKYKYAMKELIEVHWLLDYRITDVRFIQEWKPRLSNRVHSDVIIACVGN